MQSSKRWHLLEKVHLMEYMGLDAVNPVFGVCEPASAQSDQHLCYSLIGKYHNYLDLLLAKF